MKPIRILPFLLLLGYSTSYSQINQTKLNSTAEKFALNSWDLFYELLSIPNDAHYPEDIMKNVKWCENEFQARGFSTKRLKTETVPLVLAEYPISEAKETILVYLQIDGQPVDHTRWFQDDPWKPELKQKDKDGEWEIIAWDQIKKNYHPDMRVFARSTSDAKGPVAMFLTAWDAMNSLEKQPPYNLKIIMDFEEELGSPHLPAAVEKYSEELASDCLVIFDGPMHISNEPTLKFGARGIATITLTIYGPRVPQHSGHYGNYAPNPAVRLAQLIASMKNDDGTVSIDGFYDGITFNQKIKDIMAQVPDDEEFIRERIGIASTDQVGSNYQESIQYPSLNVRGLNSGWVGSKVRTIIPATATAEIDVRLVKESNPERLIELIKRHIRQQGYTLVDREPTEQQRMNIPKIAFFRSNINYQAFRTDIDSDMGNWLSKALKKVHGQEPIKIRTSGGSIPISPFVVTLGIPAVSVPTVNMDNNQHSPNENIRVGNYVDGVKTMLSILQTPYK